MFLLVEDKGQLAEVAADMGHLVGADKVHSEVEVDKEHSEVEVDKLLLVVVAGRPGQVLLGNLVMAAGHKFAQQEDIECNTVVDRGLGEVWPDLASYELFLCQNENQLHQERNISQLDR